MSGPDGAGAAALSVVIPCRNGERFLAQTIRSALNQTLPPGEIVVVDDGSTDGTRAIAEAFGPPVRVLPGAAQGAALARNAGAAATTGRYLMFLDADDLLTPPTLAALVAALGDRDRVVALCPWDRYELDDEAWIARPASAALPRPGQDRLAAWLTGSFSPPCAVLWTRAGFEASGGWLQDAGLDDDGNLLRRALARGIADVWARGGLALYRRLPGEMQSYSAKRRETFGLTSRLASLHDTVDELRRAGNLARYRAPLAEALAELARDTQDHALAPDVAALARRAGGAPSALPFRRRAGAMAARIAARRAEWRTRPGPSVAARPRDAATGAAPTTGPLVSVVIPTFDRASLVVRAVRSVLDQTWRDMEVLVVDDGSTDDTGARLAAIGDPRLTVVAQPNGGVARARNRGMARASGAWIAFLDSDDVWRPEKLSRQMARMLAAPARTGLCHTGIEIVGPDETVVQPGAAEGRIFEAALLDNPLRAPTSSGLVRREVFEAVGGFDPALPAIEDWDWLQRVTRLYDVAAVPEALVVYRDAGEARRSKDFRANMKRARCCGRATATPCGARAWRIFTSWRARGGSCGSPRATRGRAGRWCWPRMPSGRSTGRTWPGCPTCSPRSRSAPPSGARTPRWRRAVADSASGPDDAPAPASGVPGRGTRMATIPAPRHGGHPQKDGGISRAVVLGRPWGFLSGGEVDGGLMGKGVGVWGLRADDRGSAAAGRRHGRGAPAVHAPCIRGCSDWGVGAWGRRVGGTQRIATVGIGVGSSRCPRRRAVVG